MIMRWGHLGLRRYGLGIQGVGCHRESLEVRGSECFKFYKKQVYTCKALKKWNKEEFGHS